ncbi:MAG: PD-(D/E)XK nuclease domain-containing protein, partial [bacterium]
LEDISLVKEYGNICGYTHQELQLYFKDYLQNLNLDELNDNLYNPFDVLLYLKYKQTDSYWYNTGTPSFLIKLIKEKQYEVSKLDNIIIKKSMLDKFDLEEIQIEALMFQSGYLTIKEEYKTEYGIEYKLGFPNKEVKISFNENIINNITKDKNEIDLVSKKIIQIFKEEKLEDLKQQLEILFSNISYMYLKEESNHVVALFSLLYATGLNVITEDNTSKGRIDLTVIVNKRIVYIIEFKVIESEEEKGKALKQIKQKEYFKKYLNYDKIYIVGIEFNKKDKKIVNFEYEILK